MVKRVMKAATAALSLLVAAPPAFTHGAGHEAVDNAPVEVLRFAYTAGQAMDGAAVRVLEPGTERLYQVGRTDRDGRFAFVPDQPGEWIVEADDGQGHKLRATVGVGVATATDQPDTVSVPPALLLGALIASLLLNAGLLSALLARKKRAPRSRAEP